MKYTLLKDGVETTQYSGTLEENKQEALQMVSQSFIEKGKTNTYTCSLGFEVDNRWTEKNDIENIQLSLDVWFQFNDTVQFKDAHNSIHTITKDQMLQIIVESKVNRLQKIFNKWKREDLIKNSTSVDQVWSWVEATEEQIETSI